MPHADGFLFQEIVFAFSITNTHKNTERIPKLLPYLKVEYTYSNVDKPRTFCLFISKRIPQK